MPVPPLPLEVVDIILSFAATSLSEVERREECVKFALVCKTWTETAVRLAWKEVSLWKAGDKSTSLAKHLCAFPSLCRHFRVLDLRPPHEKNDASDGEGTDNSPNEDNADVEKAERDCVR